MRDVTAPDYPAPDHAVRLLRLGHDEIQLLALEEGEHRRLIDRIVAKTLLENLNLRFARGIAKNHRLRLKMNADICELHLIDSRLQLQGDLLAHDGEVLIVNGERRISAERGEREEQEKLYLHEVLFQR